MGRARARGATIRVDRQRGVVLALGLQPAELNPVTLRFRDPLLERAFRADYFRHNCMVDLKGKGPTPARFLLARRTELSAGASSS